MAAEVKDEDGLAAHVELTAPAQRRPLARSQRPRSSSWPHSASASLVSAMAVHVSTLWMHDQLVPLRGVCEVDDWLAVQLHGALFPCCSVLKHEQTRAPPVAHDARVAMRLGA